ncbi:MAG: hypothetical protein ACHQ4F_01850 [Candidatus Dormibacteria bacterium]
MQRQEPLTDSVEDSSERRRYSLPFPHLLCFPSAGRRLPLHPSPLEAASSRVGFVGPGVTARGVDAKTWADETDIRPTMMALIGLHDDYVSDGRVLVGDVSRALLPGAYGSAGKFAQLLELENAYKQVDADVGAFGVATLTASTRALESRSHGDDVYRAIERGIARLGSERDALAARISEALYGLEFEHRAIASDAAHGWINQAHALIAQASALA